MSEDGLEGAEEDTKPKLTVQEERIRGIISSLRARGYSYLADATEIRNNKSANEIARRVTSAIDNRADDAPQRFLERTFLEDVAPLFDTNTESRGDILAQKNSWPSGMERGLEPDERERIYDAYLEKLRKALVKDIEHPVEQRGILNELAQALVRLASIHREN